MSKILRSVLAFAVGSIVATSGVEASSMIELRHDNFMLTSAVSSDNSGPAIPTMKQIFSDLGDSTLWTGSHAKIFENELTFNQELVHFDEKIDFHNAELAKILTDLNYVFYGAEYIINDVFDVTPALKDASEIHKALKDEPDTKSVMQNVMKEFEKELNADKSEIVKEVQQDILHDLKNGSLDPKNIDTTFEHLYGKIVKTLITPEEVHKIQDDILSLSLHVPAQDAAASSDTSDIVDHVDGLNEIFNGLD